MGLWSHTPLKDVLSWLGGAGYECYWDGNTGTLARAIGHSTGVYEHSASHKAALLPAWCEEFGMPQRWANLVCAHEPSVLAALEKWAI